MLTSIGLAAARRALASAPPSRLALTSSSAGAIVHVSRAFSASAWARLASAATAKKVTAAKTKTAKPKPKAKTTKATKATKATKTSVTKAKKKAPVKKAVLKKKKPVVRKKKPVLKKKKVVKKTTKKAKKMTPEQKGRAELRELKEMALLKGPKMLAPNSWAVYVAQHVTGGDGQLTLVERIKTAKADYEALSAAEKESLAATGRANQVTNQQRRQAWIESLPYEAIYMANRARRQLARKLKKGRVYLLHDERLPKRANGPCSLFIKSRYRELSDSGSGQDIFRTAATEWNALSDADKKPFQDMAAAQSRKSNEEFTLARVAGEAYWQAQKSPAGGVSSGDASP